MKKIKLSKICKFLNLKYQFQKDPLIKNISNIDAAKKDDITLCLSKKYLEFLNKTKASACIVKKNFSKFVPSNCFALISSNPQIDFIKVSNLFYGDLVIDKISNNNLKKSEIKKKYKNISFGNNFICEKNFII